MASRGTIKTSIRRLLGTESDDPAFSDAILDPIVQEAVDSLRTDVDLQNPGYNSTEVTLEADSSTSRLYTFATQSTAITDFGRALEVRWTDEDGLELNEVRIDELREAGPDFYAILGIDSAPVLRVSKDSEAGVDLFMRYTAWGADLADDNSVPSGIPLRFHDVIALEALYAVALGGEERVPSELYARWIDRRGQLMHHVGKRSAQPSRTRIYSDVFD
jgi:hypothetical protein